MAGRVSPCHFHLLGGTAKPEPTTSAVEVEPDDFAGTLIYYFHPHHRMDFPNRTVWIVISLVRPRSPGSRCWCMLSVPKCLSESADVLFLYLSAISL